MNYSKAAEQSFSDMCVLVTELAGRTIQQPMDGVTIYDGGFGEFNWYSRICVDAGNAGQTEGSATAEQLLSIAAASRLPLLSFTEGNVPEAFVSGLSELGYKLEVTQTGMCVPLPLVSGNSAASRTELGYDKSHTVKSTAGADPSIVRIGAEELAAWSDTVCRAFEKPDDKNAFSLMIHIDDCHSSPRKKTARSSAPLCSIQKTATPASMKSVSCPNTAAEGSPLRWSVMHCTRPLLPAP